MKPIVLVGPPGSGKSTVGRALAQRLTRNFVDTDKLIEQTQGKSVSDIFIENGEEFFRALEFQTLENVLKLNTSVISLGGGAPISLEAQKVMHATPSTIIFLDISLAAAAPRIGFNRDRPLLLGNPRAQWQALSDKRRPIYESLSTFVVKVDGMTVDQIVDDIQSKVEINP